MRVISKIRYSFGYQVPPRLPFKEINQADIGYFQSFLQPQQLITDPYDIQPFNQSWLRTESGHSRLVLLPTNTKQISSVMAYCNQNKIAVVPQGGNTGLVGGSVPVYDEVILSLKNMNKIEKFDPISSVLSVEAGVVLDRANQYLAEYDCEVPLDLGSKGTCQLGGNAATNAGGIHLIKYGSFRSHILGLQAVLANGKILDMRTQVQKDNTGFDIKNLIIGSEGTLGIITKLNIHCPQKDKQRNIFLFKSSSYSDILEALPIVKKQLGKNLCALEYADGLTYQISTKYLNLQLLSNVSPSDHLLFVETNCEEGECDGLIEKIPEGFSQAIKSENDGDFRKIWSVRENVAAASQRIGRFMAYDLSYDVESWQELVLQLRQKYPEITILGYGHIGDGNIHINLCSKDPNAPTTINDAEIYKIIAEKRGSISAEHGVGIYKPSYVKLQKSSQILQICRKLKTVMDPNEILNPYKVLERV